ncbi:MAG: tetratricopeptide repeat protein [Rhodopirellula sp.]|nr:tetratricopeptide repeat protein [Rhodopirellula sp.]
MPARRLLHAATILCLLTGIGCQTTGSSNWSLWKSVSDDPKADLKDPERLHLAYGKLSEQTGDYATARKSYETALRQNQETEEAILGLARLDLLAGRHAEAERRFKEAVEVAPSNPLTSEALGQFYLTQNRYAEAAAQLQRGLAVAPDNKRLRHKLGIALARGGNMVAAEPQFVQAVGDAEADYNIGLILYEQGHTAEAEQRFLQAVLKKPTLAPAQHWLDTVRQEHEAQTLLAGAPNRQSSAPDVTARLQAPIPTRKDDQSAASGVNETAQAPTASTVPAPGGNIIPTGGSVAAPVRPSGLNPAMMNATQLEQYENSLSPAERSQFRAQLQSGAFRVQ